MHPSAVEKKGQPITIQMVEQRINSGGNTHWA